MVIRSQGGVQIDEERVWRAFHEPEDVSLGRCTRTHLFLVTRVCRVVKVARQGEGLMCVEELEVGELKRKFQRLGAVDAVKIRKPAGRAQVPTGDKRGVLHLAPPDPSPFAQHRLTMGEGPKWQHRWHRHGRWSNWQRHECRRVLVQILKTAVPEPRAVGPLSAHGYEATSRTIVAAPHAGLPRVLKGGRLLSVKSPGATGT